MIRRPPRSTLSSSSAASDVYKRQGIQRRVRGRGKRMYGNEASLMAVRLPAFVNQSRLSSQVLEYLQSADLFRLDETHLTAHGFDKNIDHPWIPNHVYYEGYRHASRCASAVSTMHPRAGVDHPKAAAPKELRVFLEAVRVVNAGLFGEMRERLEEQGCPASQLFAQCIAEGRHLADCAIQVHWGDAVPAESVGWHTDAPNSAVHMAISVFGKRVLHAELAGSEVAIDAAEKRADAQTAGDVYVACPATFSPVSYTHLRAHETPEHLVCRLLLEKKKTTILT
eukprot:TRINITY_DN22976_c0_g1_i3.p1 TRINITY_DN22976_c0_g1~~TRINITY_DN22976_c0_g1_i3.p1  ORF type:complete len:282 (+),score=66.86 TRINITY_DN22976_c0_g1_i3:151-996(+)